MIKPGIKIGPHQKWKHRFNNTHSQYCEVWYRVDKPSWYKDTFKYLKDRQINTGLHFWGIIDNKWEPNIAYPGPTRQKSLDLISNSLHMAAKHSFHYVNIHLGNYKLSLIDLEKHTMLPDLESKKIDINTAENTMSDSLQKLYKLADDLEVQLYVETVPAKIKLNPPDRNKVTNQYSMPPSSLIKLAKKQKLLITNDISHTFSTKYDLPLKNLWQHLWSTTVALAPYTKLLHINTVVPPYNGTDSHHGITEDDFSLKGIFPTKERFKKILSLFKDRNDVWAINEPSQNHTKNYFALKKLLKSI